MKVKELIEKLKEVDENLEVFFAPDDCHKILITNIFIAIENEKNNLYFE